VFAVGGVTGPGRRAYREAVTSPHPGADRPEVSEPHRARQLAESFGSDPERYDRTRPRYPAEVVTRILADAPGAEVLDVGIGTGVSAQPFADAGCRVLGVEVDPRMAEFARARGFTVDVGRFEDWQPGGRTFDVVIAGQAWHWVDPVVGAERAAQALRPAGRLALFWNVFEPPADLGQAFGAVYRRVLPDGPFSRGPFGGLAAYAPGLERAADGIRQVRAFEEPEQWHVPWHRDYTRDEWLEVVPTFGGHSRFPPATLDALLAGLGDAIDAAGGSFTMDFVTVVVTARLSG
jgi:SAM-dependent methyltransferase